MNERLAGPTCQGLCKAWTCPGVFQKVTGKTNKGVVLYQYYSHDREYECDSVKSYPIGKRTERRVIILQNTSNTDIAVDMVMKEIYDSTCECALCFDVLQHVCKIIKDMHIIKKHEVNGICDCCKRRRNHYCNRCSKCNEAVRSFMNKQALKEDTEHATRLKIWFCKVHSLLNDILGRGRNHLGISLCGRICSDTQLNELLQLIKSTKSYRAPDVEELVTGNIRRVQSLQNVTDYRRDDRYDQLEPTTTASCHFIEPKPSSIQTQAYTKSKGETSITRQLKADAREQSKSPEDDLLKLRKYYITAEPKDDGGNQGLDASGKGKFIKVNAIDVEKDVAKSKGKQFSKADNVKDKNAVKVIGSENSKLQSKGVKKEKKIKNNVLDKTDRFQSSGKDDDKEKRKLKEKDADKAKPLYSEHKNEKGKSKGKDSDAAEPHISKIKDEKGKEKFKGKALDVADQLKSKSKEKVKDNSKTKGPDIAEQIKKKGKESETEGKEKVRGKIKEEKSKDPDITEKHQGKDVEKGKNNFKGKDSDALEQAQVKDKDGEKAKGKTKSKDPETFEPTQAKTKPKAKKDDAVSPEKPLQTKTEDNKTKKEDDEFFKMLKASKDQKAKELSKAQEKALKDKKPEKIQETPRKVIEKPALKERALEATLSQMLLFQQKATEQRDLIVTVGGKHKAQSTMSSFNEEISKKLHLDQLPEVGIMYESMGDDSPLDLQMAEQQELEKSSLRTDNMPSPGMVAGEVPLSLQYSVKTTKTGVFKSCDNVSVRHAQEKRAAQQSDSSKMIVGSKVCKYNPVLLTKPKQEVEPLFFKVTKSADSKDSPFPTSPKNFIVSGGGDTKMHEANNLRIVEGGTRSARGPKEYNETAPPDATRGVIRYALSDRQFIEKGWTMLPTEKIVRKMNVYRMRPAKPKFDWFLHNKVRCPMMYDSGELLADIEEDGRGRWMYRNGLVAMEYYSAEMNAQQRYVVHSSGEGAGPEPRSAAGTVLACFDWSGTAVVFDHAGKVRLKYNQTEGVLLDKSLGPVTHWKWHTLNDPPVLQQVMIDTQLTHKDPEILKYGQGKAASMHKLSSDNEEMLAIEYNNFVKEKSKKLTQKFKPYQIKMKALKINDQFSLRILDQASIYLLFRDGQNSLKLNVGMLLDPREIVDTDTAELGEVASSYDKYPARTDSLARIQNSVANAQKIDKLQADRTQRIRRPHPQLSIERLKDVLYRPS